MFEYDDDGTVRAEYCDSCGCDTSNPCGCVDENEPIIAPCGCEYHEGIVNPCDYHSEHVE